MNFLSFSRHLILYKEQDKFSMKKSRNILDITLSKKITNWKKMSCKEFTNCSNLLLSKLSLCINMNKSKALTNNLVRKLPYFSILFLTFFCITILKLFSLAISLLKLIYFLMKTQAIHQFMDCLMMTGKSTLNFKIQL